MVCDLATYSDYWLEFRPFDGVVCLFADQVGLPVFAAIVYGGVMLGMARWSGGIVVPLVLTLITGTVFVSVLPGELGQLGVIFVVIGVAAAGIQFVRKLEATT